MCGVKSVCVVCVCVCGGGGWVNTFHAGGLSYPESFLLSNGLRSEVTKYCSNSYEKYIISNHNNYRVSGIFPCTHTEAMSFIRCGMWMHDCAVTTVKSPASYELSRKPTTGRDVSVSMPTVNSHLFR